MRPYVLGAVFARGGSKGVPLKNIQVLAGKPLIAYAIETGLAVSLIDRMIMSTDNQEIAEVARQYGGDVPFMRPTELATDDSLELLSWQHAIFTIEEQTGQQIDVLVSLPATSPLRTVEDVETCVKTLLESNADAVITVTPSTRNPYFNMVTLDNEGNARLVMQPQRGFSRRQDVPPVYDMTTVAYAVRSSYVRSGLPLLDGTVKAVVVPQERALDIDTPLDLEIAEFLLTMREQGR